MRRVTLFATGEKKKRQPPIFRSSKRKKIGPAGVEEGGGKVSIIQKECRSLLLLKLKQGTTLKGGLQSLLRGENQKHRKLVPFPELMGKGSRYEKVRRWGGGKKGDRKEVS